MNVQQTTTSDQQTMALAAQLGAKLQGGDIITLSGDLGAGKTCFVRGLAIGMGINPREVSSPTYVICQEYAGPDTRTLVHIDAYRLSSEDELESIGWDDLVNDPHAVLAIEWPSNIAHALEGLQCIGVDLEHIDSTTRMVRIEAAGAIAARLEVIHE